MSDGVAISAPVVAGDVAEEVDLDSAANSIHQMELEPVDKHAKVHSDVRIVKDKKSGRHYKAKRPAYSLARSKGAARVGGSSYHGASIGLGHAMTNSNSNPGSTRNSLDDGYRGGTSNKSNTAIDSATLLDQLRLLIREEVQRNNRGHADQLRQHMEEAITKVGKDEEETKYSTGDSKYKLKSSMEEDVGLKSESPSTNSDSSEGEDEIQFPNGWARLRYRFREPLAEFLACFILITFGDGINVQVVGSGLYDPSSPKGSYLSISFGWGVAVMMAVYTAGGISGGHLNPGVTLALATFRGFPWRKVPGYIVAQLAGATSGALCIYGLYIVPLRIIDPGQTETTASLFTTYPATFLRGTAALRSYTAYNEIYASAILLIVIFAIGDSGNAPPTEGMAPLVLMWLIWGLGATLGWQTAYAVNMIRDWGPRIALTIVGYEGLWSFENGYFAYTPMASTICGALLGAFIYDVLIYTGGESWVNKPWRWGRSRPGPHSKSKMPMAIDA